LPSNCNRSYFIKELFQKIIITESTLTSYSQLTLKNKAWVKKVFYSASAGIILIGITGFVIIHLSNKNHALKIQSYIQQYKTAEIKLKNKELIPTSALTLLNPLSSIIATHRIENFWVEIFPFYKPAKIKLTATDTLWELLEIKFLPCIATRLENLLVIYRNQPARLQETLNGYLALGNPHQFSTNGVKNVMLYDWSYNLRLNTEQQQELKYYLEQALLKQKHSLPLNKNLITQTVIILKNTPPEQKIYEAIKNQAFTASNPQLNLWQKLGNQATKLLTANYSLLLPAWLTRTAFIIFYLFHFLSVFKVTQKIKP